jgi:hypothetical protein
LPHEAVCDAFIAFLFKQRACQRVFEPKTLFCRGLSLIRRRFGSPCQSKRAERRSIVCHCHEIEAVPPAQNNYYQIQKTDSALRGIVV